MPVAVAVGGGVRGNGDGGVVCDGNGHGGGGRAALSPALPLGPIGVRGGCAGVRAGGAGGTRAAVRVAVAVGLARGTAPGRRRAAGGGRDHLDDAAVGAAGVRSHGARGAVAAAAAAAAATTTAAAPAVAVPVAVTAAVVVVRLRRTVHVGVEDRETAEKWG